MTPAQCRAARALVDITQPKLAEAVGLSLSTIVDFERSRRTVSVEARVAIHAALEAAGVVFVGENGGGPGVRLSRPPGHTQLAMRAGGLRKRGYAIASDRSDRTRCSVYRIARTESDAVTTVTAVSPAEADGPDPVPEAKPDARTGRKAGARTRRAA